MARFTVNATRIDRYENFKFRVFWEGSNTPVAGVSEVSALERSAEVAEYREGGDPSNGGKLPGRSEYEPVTLERGVTHDAEFAEWANKARNHGPGLAGKVSLEDFRRNVIIEMYNEAGQPALRYKVYRCWVSEFTALPDLGANANAVAIQSIKLENEGWKRDYQRSEPSRSTSARQGKKARVLRRRRRSR